MFEMASCNFITNIASTNGFSGKFQEYEHVLHVFVILLMNSFWIYTGVVYIKLLTCLHRKKIKTSSLVVRMCSR